jgi:hypothetical protein
MVLGAVVRDAAPWDDVFSLASSGTHAPAIAAPMRSRQPTTRRAFRLGLFSPGASPAATRPPGTGLVDGEG